jgi:hypothetical protein
MMDSTMKLDPMISDRWASRRWRSVGTLVLLMSGLLAGARAGAEGTQDPNDPRVGLAPGWRDAGEASSNITMRSHRDLPPGFFDPEGPGNRAYSNTDLAFRGDYAFVGNYNGFNVYNIRDPENPELQVSVVCPGGQGDLSVYGQLVFMSVEETRSRLDCGAPVSREEVPGVDPARFRGVRIFDVSDIRNPVQVAAVQTCRGSHTHTIVSDPNNDQRVYLYVSGTGAVRSGVELDGCLDIPSPDEPDTSFWRISVVEVPLDAPENARIVSEPRVFTNPETGSIAGLWDGGDHGPDTQESSQTTSCHDITAYPQIGLAAGACQGNGVLFDIRDPANPVRIAEVTDPNFAYWHSATFNNDGTKVIFTDEWGGGSAPRCLETDPPTWGANAVFDLIDEELHFASYYKLPAPQTELENCVAHNGSLVPVPGRDIKVQAWYQGGLSVFDFTDSDDPFEIAYFDRGPIDDTELRLAGYWSTYWYNGYIYGSEIGRGLDVFQLTPSEHLSQNEIDAANLVRYETFNVQEQPRVSWPASFAVARAYLDQIRRTSAVTEERIAELSAQIADAEEMVGGSSRRATLAEIATQLWADAGSLAGPAGGETENRIRALAGAMLDLAAVER